MTHTTEPTIDELVEMCFDDLCINNTGNYIRITFGDKSMNVDYEHFLAFRKRIEALISNQVAKARIEELEHIVSGSEYSADDFDWYEITRAEYTGTKYYSEVRHLTKEERIAELEATLNGVKNK